MKFEPTIMASVLDSLYSPELQAMPMGVCDARLRPLMLGRQSVSRFSFLGAERILSPYTCHQMPLRSPYKITLHLGIQNCLFRSPVMSVSKGNFSISCRELCKVLWTIEANVEDGQLLYITGDPTALGYWEPEMAVLMTPAEHSNLWKTEVKVPCGMNFKYNYFIKGDKWSSSHLIWRPGPETSLSVPQTSKLKEKIVVRDSWMTFCTQRHQVQSWGSWIWESCFPVQSMTSDSSRDELGIYENPQIDALGTESFSVDLRVEDESYSVGKDDTVDSSTEAWDSGHIIYERDQPVEEPWLLQSSLSSLDFKAELGSSVYNEIYDPIMLTQPEFLDKGYQDDEKLLTEEESKSICTEESVDTVILINSSICTMQRIAVLENGNLVELLLEPVKHNVQCDSVYLGVVTKLVPHMGGAFVNIGISRPSLMDIKQNREPFVFPPFRHRTKEKQINGSVISELQELSDVKESDPSSHGDVGVLDDLSEIEFQDGLVPFTHDDLDEHEVEDDFDASEVLQGNVNGSMMEYGGVESDSEDFFDGNGHNLEGKATCDFLPNEPEGTNDPQLSHHSFQDGKGYIKENKWAHVRKGTKVIVQVVKEGLGTKGPALTAYPNLRSRFWILSTRCARIGISKKISGIERTRLRVIAKTLQPPGFGLTVRTVAGGRSLEELQKDLEGLLSTWKDITEHAKSAALASDEGVEGAVPVILHRAMGQTLSIVQDYFNEKVKSMVVDSPRTYHEVTTYLQDIAPDLCDRVELYNKRNPIFDEYGVEEEINGILNKRVPLANGGSLVIEQTEALVSIDVNGGHGMLGRGTSQEKAILEVNLAAAKQIARELRLRDIGGIIVVDFIDMVDESNKRLVYEEMKKAVERDRSTVRVSELSRQGLMEITRKRVRPSVSFMISEPCTCCHATGRIEALETSFSKIEHEICRLLAILDQKADPENPKSWPKFILRVDRYMCNYLTSGKRTRLGVLSSSLKVWILLKVARGFTRGSFEVKPFTGDKAKDEQHPVAISRLRSTDAGSSIPGTQLTLFPIKKWKTRGK
ncbi:ribonuclease E/G-like protein, chloroplastic isoform X1 [Macadamia integrifolia]|uniref:ribonuclease E/G-like protein, chloroplastic isoform X1 n=2 Tax=Macadamia integrifolia TaxID=60698 RepID=UPI001C4EB496|nr:ribonuclease E/G-like protein, chloroplastic isoform X1 [Macadamia integrifolia]